MPKGGISGQLRYMCIQLRTEAEVLPVQWQVGFFGETFLSGLTSGGICYTLFTVLAETQHSENQSLSPGELPSLPASTAAGLRGECFQLAEAGMNKVKGGLPTSVSAAFAGQGMLIFRENPWVGKAKTARHKT